MDKMRAEFEAWAKQQLWEIDWGEIEYGAYGYLSDLTQGAWLLWQDEAARQPERGEAVAWMTEDGERCVTERTMAGARKDGGAMLSSLSAYVVPLTYAHPPADDARVAELEAQCSHLASALAERTAQLTDSREQEGRMREALEAMLEIHGVTQRYADTHIEIPQSWVEVSEMARAALAAEKGEK